jgi:hypothetical protein
MRLAHSVARPRRRMGRRTTRAAQARRSGTSSAHRILDACFFFSGSQAVCAAGRLGRRFVSALAWKAVPRAAMASAGLGSRDLSVNRDSVRNPAGDRANGSRGARMPAFSFTKKEKREQAWPAEKSGAAYRGQFAPRGFVLPRPGYEDNSGATRLHKTEASHGLGIRPREPRGLTLQDSNGAPLHIASHLIASRKRQPEMSAIQPSGPESGSADLEIERA